MGYRMIFMAVLVFFQFFVVSAQSPRIVIADSLTRLPLPSASVFDCRGKAAGICDHAGRMPYIPAESYPVTIRYIGYKENIVDGGVSDTVFLQPVMTELPEIVIGSRQQKILHVLAYVREYSTLTTTSDTVFLFREKMVDYMLPQGEKSRYDGWAEPRVLKCKSYYRFTDVYGNESVSPVCNHHFSWSDWVGIAPDPVLPKCLKDIVQGTDTIMGKYSPTEVWIKNDDRVTVDVDVLADSASRKWVPNLSLFFRSYLDFENFRVRFSYDNIVDNEITVRNLTGYSFNIDSNGRGHDMFRFNRHDEPFFVSTYAEVYIADKEFITVKEAKKWEHRKFDTEQMDIFEPAEVPPLQPSISELVDRVNSLDNDKVRQGLTPDKRLAGRHVVKQHIGDRLLMMLKTFTGISGAKAQRHLNNRWSEFRKQRLEESSRHTGEEEDK